MEKVQERLQKEQDEDEDSPSQLLVFICNCQKPAYDKDHSQQEPT